MSCKPDTKKLSDILPYVLPYCQALPEEMGMDYGRRSYIEMAKRAGGIVKTITVDLQEGVFDYPLDAPDDYLVNRVNWVQIEGYRHVMPNYDHDGPVSAPYGNQSLYRSYSGGSMNGSYGYGPNYWYACGHYQFRVEGYDHLWLQRAPIRDCKDGMLVEMSVMPSQEICYFDDDFFDRWCEGIAYGALAKAMLLPNTDWYNPETAKYFDGKFRAEVARLRHKIDLNYSRGPMRMRARRFV